MHKLITSEGHLWRSPWFSTKTIGDSLVHKQYKVSKLLNAEDTNLLYCGTNFIYQIYIYIRSGLGIGRYSKSNGQVGSYRRACVSFTLNLSLRRSLLIREM